MTGSGPASPSSSSPVIRCETLTKRYNGIPALDGLTLEIPEGSIGLLGENGAGKTTFLKLLLGLLRPTAGSARVLGYDLSRPREALELRRRVGYMPEDDCLPPDSSALDLLVRLGRLSGLPKETAVQRTHDVLHLVGLGEERYRPIGGYSTGMKQRVKLAQALVHSPQLVLLDEPTSGLDPQGREEMLALIREIRAKMDLSLVLSTHLLPDVEKTCDHVIILRAGRLLAQGPLRELLSGLHEGIAVRIVGDRGAFLRGLQGRGLRAEVRGPGEEILVYAPSPSPSDDPDSDSDPDSIYDILVETAAAAGVQLRRMERLSRSLEELYLELYGESSE